VDLTPGRGCFWRGDIPTNVTVERSTHDFRHLPYADRSYDVPLLDPRHNADAGVRSVMGQRYGTYKHADLERVVRQGAREAWRVARLGVIVKVTDAVHAQCFVRMSRWVYEELGEPYDLVHQLHRALIDPKWREPQLSARNNGSTYLVFRRDRARHVRTRIERTARSPPLTFGSCVYRQPRALDPKPAPVRRQATRAPTT
jgi:hypothetical protein